tara:strand:+ start:626 stop:2347 length:1722 start_codon:yes stop_codon:yes gene_type:complete
MAKKTSTGRVVDIAALSRIGRTRTAPLQPENRNMDKFLQFAGTIAVNLFSKAFNKKLEMNEKNSIKIDDFKVDNKDAYKTIPALDKAITDYQNMYNDGTKKKVGIFNLPVSEKAKGRSQEGRDLISQADIGLSSLEEETSIYQNGKQVANDITNKGFITDPDGKQITAIYSGYNLPEQVLFKQAYADGILDNYIQIKDGKFYLPQDVIENIDKIVDGDKTFKPKTDNLTPQDKWTQALLKQTEKYDDIRLEGSSVAINLGLVGDYTEADGVIYRKTIKKGVDTMQPNEVMSSLYDTTVEYKSDGSIAETGRTIIDNFIDNPTFEVKIDHDGDPNTDKAIFDGTQKYIEREFGENKTEETLTKEEADQLALWKQGVTNELKTALNPNDPQLKTLLIDTQVEQLKFEQQERWKTSPNNPANKPREEISVAKMKFIEEKQVLENDVNRFLNSTTSGEPYFYSDGKDQYKAVTNNGMTSIYKMNISDTEEGTYTDVPQRTIGTGNAFDIIFEGKNLNKPEGLNTLTATEILDQNNPKIPGTSFRYDQFEEKNGKWFLKGTTTRIKDKSIVNELNRIQ